MTLRLVHRLWLFSSLLVAALGLRVQAQTSGLGANLVLRAQAAAIAEDALGRIGDSLSAQKEIGVQVDGGSARPLIENAFLELLSRKGVRATLQGPSSNGRRLIQINVLDQSVRYTATSSGDFRREIQTAVEARRSSGDSSSVMYLGMFKRQDVDTVSFREDVGLIGPPQEAGRTLFDRLLGPILLIGGGFLIVYLFFTVRN